MADRLLFDVVLHAGGLHDPADYFPPSNKDTLRELLKKIDILKFDSLKRDCLVYSLLKWHRDGREKVFRDERCIPPQFSALSDAYWHLDAGVEVEVRVFTLIWRLTRSASWFCMIGVWLVIGNACAKPTSCPPAVMLRPSVRVIFIIGGEFMVSFEPEL